MGLKRIEVMATELKSVTFEGAHCAVELKQFSQSLILMGLSGSDTGELRDAPMRTLDGWLAQAEAVEFFIDARKVRGASIDVSSDWAAWFTAHRERFKSITMLTGNKFIQITAEFVRRLPGWTGLCGSARMRKCSTWHWSRRRGVKAGGSHGGRPVTN
jgi:hypothetical protein